MAARTLEPCFWGSIRRRPRTVNRYGGVFMGIERVILYWGLGRAWGRLNSGIFCNGRLDRMDSWRLGAPRRKSLDNEVYAMLVITRKEGEEVVIGDPAAPLGIVRIASIKGDRVKIAFDFPHEVKLLRRELADKHNASEKDGDPIAGKIRPASGGEAQQ